MKIAPLFCSIFLLLGSSVPAISQINIDRSNIQEHYSKYNKAEYPKGRTVTVCSGHGCTYAESFTFDYKFLGELKSHFNSVKNASEERNVLKKVIALIEQNVGTATGTDKDRASLGVFGAGNRTQLDCVDEATNTTSYLLVLNRLGVIKYHDIKAPNWKGGLFKWTHYAAVIEDKSTKVLWAIDSGVGDNGKPPLIVEYSKWYE